MPCGDRLCRYLMYGKVRRQAKIRGVLEDRGRVTYTHPQNDTRFPHAPRRLPDAQRQRPESPCDLTTSHADDHSS